MTLNLNISHLGANSAAQSLESAKDAMPLNAANAKDKTSFNALSITSALASPDEIAASSISEAALRRDDPLGNLVKSAFNLPPPPPPWL